MKFISLLLIFIFITFSIYSEVESSDKPLKGIWDFKMTKIWSIENMGNLPIGSIQNVKIGKEDRVYLIDQKNFKIGIYKKDGEFIKSFGKKGEGPGEIKELFGGSQLFLTEKSLVIADRTRVHYFSMDGDYKKTIILPFNIQLNRIISDSLFISAPKVVRDPQKKEAHIVLYNSIKKTQKIIAKFNPFKKATSSQVTGSNVTTVSIIIEDITPMMILGFSNNILYYGMNSFYKIHYYNFKTNKTDSFSISGRKPNPVSDEYKNNLKKRLSHVPSVMLKKIVDGLPTHASFFDGIITDLNSKYIYLSISNPELKNTKQIDVFNKKGNFIYKAYINIEKNSQIKLITFKNNFLYLVVLDEEGIERLVKYSINIPE